jgi:DNA-binding NarL/FixJ family response regulator/DNA-binding CsgD family transcriptional regulator
MSMSELESLSDDLGMGEGLIFQPNPSNPIDCLVDEYRKVVALDTLPTATEQQTIIRGVQQRGAESARALINRHRGLIAVIAYQFKNRGTGNKELLIIGGEAMLQAARTQLLYDPEGFNDYAISVMNSALSQAVGEDPTADDYEPPRLGSMDDVTNFVTSLHPDKSYKPIFPPNNATLPLVKTLAYRLRILNQQRAAREIARLSPSAQMILPLLHLPTSEIAQKNDLTPKALRHATKIIFKELDVHTRPQLAFLAYIGGVHFAIKSPPPIEKLTLRQRQVAGLYLEPSRVIASELDLSKEQVDHTAASLYADTGARTRIEVMLMAQTPGFVPTKQEIEAAKPHESLEGFTPLQAAVLQRLHLPVATIATELGRSPDTINNMAGRLRKHFGLASNGAVVQEMRSRGLKYDIVVPKRPLEELLHNEAIDVAGRVADSNQAIGKAMGLDPDRVRAIVNYAKHRTGVRSRAELLVVVKEYDTGKRRPVDARTPRQKLADHLGRETLDDCYIEKYVARLSPQKRQIMELRYLVDGETTQPRPWLELKREFGWYNPASIANKAIKQLRAMIAADEAP